MRLNDGQKEAIKRAMMWYFDRNRKPCFVLAGSAGTGKSTTASTCVTMLGLSTYQVLYACPTGKAASVLRSKGCIANTIHSVFFRPIASENGAVHFAKKKVNLSNVKLIVLDEVSMVDQKMMDQVLSFGVPVLALGDPGQLPPIYGSNQYILNPDVFLEEIMRQKGDSGILQLATMARKDIPIPYGKYLESEVVHIGQVHNIEDYDVVISWTNRTRKDINALIRKKRGYDSIYPQAGERLVCLRNSYIHSIDCGDDMVVTPVNGMPLTALSNALPRSDCIQLDYAPDWIKDQLFSTKVSKTPFESYRTGEEYESDIPNYPIDEVVLDYGFCITCQKSQGSEFGKVLVLDEYHGNKETYNKWLYTAITRAQESVTIARFE